MSRRFSNSGRSSRSIQKNSLAHYRIATIDLGRGNYDLEVDEYRNALAGDGQPPWWRRGVTSNWARFFTYKGGRERAVCNTAWRFRLESGRRSNRSGSKTFGPSISATLFKINKDTRYSCYWRRPCCKSIHFFIHFFSCQVLQSACRNRPDPRHGLLALTPGRWRKGEPALDAGTHLSPESRLDTLREPGSLRNLHSACDLYAWKVSLSPAPSKTVRERLRRPGLHTSALSTCNKRADVQQRR